MSDVVGSIGALWRFPVKSMRAERVDVADLTAGGLAGDRAYALVDTRSGKVLSGKTPSIGRKLLACHAAFVQQPQVGEPPPPVRITLPDGATVTSDDLDADAVLSKFVGFDVALSRAAPPDFTIDQYYPDIEGLDPERRGTITESKLGSAFFADIGLPSAVPSGSFFDLFPVSVLTTSTLDRLHELRSESTFDARRFRMNVIIATPGRGFVENSWLGRSLGLGERAQLDVMIPDPRCVMTTLAQDELPKDDEVLRTLAHHNKIDVAGTGLYPCAGVYATVREPGLLRTGDDVTLTSPTG